jgi:hypothetical protein
MKILALKNKETWPEDVLNALEEHYELFLKWELYNSQMVDNSQTINGRNYDKAVNELQSVLRRGYVLRGYHCTRLTDHEIQQITMNGMQVPDLNFFYDRIDAIEQAGKIEYEIAQLLKNNNQANDSNRKGKIWFCFFKPSIAGQSGIERLFRSWGGEALYNSHESDPVTGPVLKSIGTPCLIDAFVPIASLSSYGVCFKIIRQYLINRGLNTEEPVDHEDRATQPIPAQNISRIIQFPDQDFISLTKCDGWIPLLN